MKLKQIISGLLFFSIFLTACAKVEHKSETKKVTQIEKYCYIKGINNTNNKTVVTIDPILYLKYSELTKKATPGKVIKLPNGFCYYNKDEKSETLELKEDALIIMQTFSFDADGNFNFNQQVTAKQFSDKFNDNEDLPFKFAPYRVLTKRDIITNITEIYIP